MGWVIYVADPITTEIDVFWSGIRVLVNKVWGASVKTAGNMYRRVGGDSMLKAADWALWYASEEVHGQQWTTKGWW